MQEILEQFKISFFQKYAAMMGGKLGLYSSDSSDPALIAELESVLPLVETDMTIFFRNLANYKISDQPTQKKDIRNLLGEALYDATNLTEDITVKWLEWYEKYRQRLLQENVAIDLRRTRMNMTNPKYVLRNYMAQMAIDQADQGNYELIAELYQVLKKPYDEQPEHMRWYAKRPEWARHKVGCSMLSCSS
jgi:uncharacterized protein YdiU (UPF0061 family)